MAAVRKRFPEILLSVDANSAYRLQEVHHLKKFDDYGLLMMEQPLSWDDMYDHSQLQPQIKTAICLDESIHNSEHARAAIEMGACRIINIKLGRVGGHSEAKRVEEVSRARNIPVWCGGMLETGIGRAHNIAMSSLRRIRFARRRFRQPALLGRGHHRARGAGLARGHHSRAHRSRTGICCARKTH